MYSSFAYEIDEEPVKGDLLIVELQGETKPRSEFKDPDSASFLKP